MMIEHFLGMDSCGQPLIRAMKIGSPSDLARFSGLRPDSGVTAFRDNPTWRVFAVSKFHDVFANVEAEQAASNFEKVMQDKYKSDG
jgi:hypothetical protein